MDDNFLSVQEVADIIGNDIDNIVFEGPRPLIELSSSNFVIINSGNNSRLSQVVGQLDWADTNCRAT